VSFLPESAAVPDPDAPATLAAGTLIPAPLEFKEGAGDNRILYLSCASAGSARHNIPIPTISDKPRCLRVISILSPTILAARIQRMYTAATQNMHVPKQLLALALMSAMAATAAVGYSFQSMPPAAASCADSRDLRLTNGKFMTLNRQNTTATEVTIQN